MPVMGGVAVFWLEESEKAVDTLDESEYRPDPPDHPAADCVLAGTEVAIPDVDGDGCVYVWDRGDKGEQKTPPFAKEHADAACDLDRRPEENLGPGVPLVVGEVRLENRVYLRFSGRFAHVATIHHVGRRSGTPYATPVRAYQAHQEVVIPLPYGTASTGSATFKPPDRGWWI